MAFMDNVGGWFNQLTGRQQAMDAAKKQQRLASQAAGQYEMFNTPQYQQQMQGVMNRLASGAPAQVDQTQYQREYVQPMTQQFENSVMPAVNQSMSRNFWSSGRQQAQQNAAQALGNQLNTGFLNLQAQADRNQQSALDKLMANRQNYANALLGQASMVKADPSVLQGIGNLINTAGGVMGLLGQGSVLLGGTQGNSTPGGAGLGAANAGQSLLLGGKPK